VPFCVRACPYCDFDFVVNRHPPVDAYVKGLAAEWRVRERAWAGDFATIYIGGGTPSALGASGLAQLLAWIREVFPGSGATEFTVELNPEHVSRDVVRSLQDFGVGRVSVGVQSFNDRALVQLGRRHRHQQAHDVLAMLVADGFQVSTDLIVGWVGQKQSEVIADARAVLASGVQHVSVYALTIEETSHWPALVARKQREMPDSDEQGERLRDVNEVFEANGFVHYEIASYARAGAIAQHNRFYWTCRDVLGLGPSAHSVRYDDRGAVRRTANVRGYESWLAQPGIEASDEELHGEAAVREALWVGLRYLLGVDVSTFLQQFSGIDRAFLERICRRQIEIGNLEWIDEGNTLRVAPERWYWHDRIGRDLLDVGSN
jgi:oxygen-independent coproporphyrinogen-3 oxidase